MSGDGQHLLVNKVSLSPIRAHRIVVIAFEGILNIRMDIFDVGFLAGKHPQIVILVDELV